MTNIIFFTSNQTKMAHVSYLGEVENMGIKNFRQLTYHANYKEPRIYNREELLSKSVDGALEQSKKSGLVKCYTNNTESRTNNGELFSSKSVDNALKQSQKAEPVNEGTLFLIEDTSVIIHALSAPNKEVPGLDIKYWMKEMTFQKLDELLAQSGDRRVTVRSDMVLFNADKSVNEHFFGTMDGVVVKKEIAINTNLLYPWLDGESFNKWFVPNGHKKPISLLSIKEADKVDFRKKAFVKVSGYIKNNINYSRRFIKETRIKQDLLVKNNFFIFIGYSCAGKTTIAQYLSERHRILHFEASDFMRLAFYERHGIKDIKQLDNFAGQALADKPSIVAEKIVNKIAGMGNLSDIALTGFRSPKELDYLISELDHRYIFKVILVETSVENRAKRAKKRDRANDAMTVNAMKCKDEMQKDMGLTNFLESYVDKSFNNNKTKKDLFKQADLFLSESIGQIHAFSTDFRGGLKYELMKSLLKHYQSEKYFTTTEISKNVGHHKDNISRFFNQQFHPEFEITRDEGRNKFRLSNTGYSQALLYSKHLPYGNGD